MVPRIEAGATFPPVLGKDRRLQLFFQPLQGPGGERTQQLGAPSGYRLDLGHKVPLFRVGQAVETEIFTGDGELVAAD